MSRDDFPGQRPLPRPPDWCLHVPNRENSPARLQYVLDMTRKDVRDNIFAQMYKVLSENKIDYVKWDFNRNLTEVGSALLPPERQKEVMHRFVLGTYDLMDRFVKAFPNILFENCSGGGGRSMPACCIIPRRSGAATTPTHRAPHHSVRHVHVLPYLLVWRTRRSPPAHLA